MVGTVAALRKGLTPPQQLNEQQHTHDGGWGRRRWQHHHAAAAAAAAPMHTQPQRGRRHGRSLRQPRRRLRARRGHLRHPTARWPLRVRGEIMGLITMRTD
jgi:hypothetical protein